MSVWRESRQLAGDGPSGLSREEVRHVRAVLAMSGVPWDELEDGVQQVGLKMLELRTKPGREEIHDRRAWLSVVASRLAVDGHRARGRDADLRERLAARWSRRPPVGRSEEDQVLALAVAQGLARLSGGQRQVLVLRFYADLPVRDIALLLCVPEGTVKSRLHAAVAALRTRLEELEVIQG
jgi:RNA polymerase sigma-70 factor (ECF subfamily)